MAQLRDGVSPPPSMARSFESPILDRVKECQTAQEVTTYQYELLDQTESGSRRPFEGEQAAAAHAVMAYGAAGFEDGMVEERIRKTVDFHRTISRLRDDYALIHDDDIMAAGVIRGLNYRLIVSVGQYKVRRGIVLGPVAVVTPMDPPSLNRKKREFPLDLRVWPRRVASATDRHVGAWGRSAMFGSTDIGRWFPDQDEETLEQYKTLATLVSAAKQKRS